MTYTTCSVIRCRRCLKALTGVASVHQCYRHWVVKVYGTTVAMLSSEAAAQAVLDRYLTGELKSAYAKDGAS